VRTLYQLQLRALPASNLQVGAEEGTTAKSEALVLEAKSSAQSGLETPLPPSMGHGTHSHKGHGTRGCEGHGTHSCKGHDAARTCGIEMPILTTRHCRHCRQLWGIVGP